VPFEKVECIDAAWTRADRSVVVKTQAIWVLCLAVTTVGFCNAATPPAPAGHITGVGGVFFKAKDPKALSGWYRENLGVAGKGGAPWSAFDWREREDPAELGTTVWALFKSDTKYFAPSQAPFMINYRVRNLDRMLAQLRANGVTVEPKIAEESNGRFAWVVDPEGNKIELWEPKEGN